MLIRKSLTPSLSPSSSSSFIAVRAYFNGASKPQRLRSSLTSCPSSSSSATRSLSIPEHPSRVYATRTIGRRYTSSMSSNDALPTTLEALEAEIAVQTAHFNDLRLNADKSVATPEALADAKKKLADLKKALGQAKSAGKEKKPKAEGGAAAATAAGQGEKKKERLLLKTAKGTRDYGPAETFCRDHIERIVKEVFTSFGASCLDTPVFERKDVLTDKYGEDAKLIFDLKDQGGEELALRYDHTVPLGRYLAMNGGTVTHHKIWQIGKVYRRDNPVVSKGRMREFSQADFDIAGAWDPMVPDAEIISLVCTILSKLDVGEFTIKLNNRKILDGIFEVCGVPEDKIRTISSAVDKLDKSPWSEVKREMTEEKGLDPAVADKIGEYVKHKGGPTLLDTLLADKTLMANRRAKEGVDEMGILFRLLNAYQIVDKISFDLSLARGLDYYTGIIYEAVVAASAPPGLIDASTSAAPLLPPSSSSSTYPSLAPSSSSKKKPASKIEPSPSASDEPEIDPSQVGVGSIAAGGRYDNLVTSFLAGASGISPTLNPKEYKKLPHVPCVGISIGMDRIFALVWPRWAERFGYTLDPVTGGILGGGGRSKETMVYVMSAGDGLLEERISLVQLLRDGGIKADFLAKSKPKLSAQFAAGEKDEVPFAIILGSDELKEGFVTVKKQMWEVVRPGDAGGEVKRVKIESQDKGEKVKRDELVQWLKETEVWKSWVERRWV